jgi:hypothetical protein
MKIPLEMPRSRFRDNIKIDLKEVGCDAVDMIQVIHTRVQ